MSSTTTSLELEVEVDERKEERRASSVVEGRACRCRALDFCSDEDEKDEGSDQRQVPKLNRY